MQAFFYLLGLCRRDIGISALIMPHQTRRYPDALREFGSVQEIKSIEKSRYVVLVFEFEVIQVIRRLPASLRVIMAHFIQRIQQVLLRLLDSFAFPDDRGLEILYKCTIPVFVLFDNDSRFHRRYYYTGLFALDLFDQLFKQSRSDFLGAVSFELHLVVPTIVPIDVVLAAMSDKVPTVFAGQLQYFIPSHTVALTLQI